MLNISEPPSANQGTSGFNHPFFELAFRSHFLLASFTSIVALIVWLANLNSIFTFDLSGLSPTIWHAHEMIFGFGATVAVGFIMTAVQTWAGRPSLSKKPLAFLILLWCGIRVLFWMNTATSISMGILLQALWWMMIIYHYARIVITAQNRRNYLFIPLLIVMGTLNILMLYFDTNNQSLLALHLARSSVLLFTLLMTIVGGRVIPFFTIRGANTEAITMPKMLEHAILLVSVSAVVIFIAGPDYINTKVFIMVMLLSGSLHIVRMAFWRTSKTITVPLLWSLHLAYFMMALGLLLLGFSQIYAEVQVSSALHVITVGAIGLMITSMMSRVSLGHTGRMLTPKPIISWAFVFIFLAAIVRVVMPLFGLVVEAWTISVGLWVLAQLIFLLVYIPILTSPKVSL